MWSTAITEFDRLNDYRDSPEQKKICISHKREDTEKLQSLRLRDPKVKIFEEKSRIEHIIQKHIDEYNSVINSSLQQEQLILEEIQALAVNWDGPCRPAVLYDESICVRPAMWVDLSTGVFETEARIYLEL